MRRYLVAFLICACAWASGADSIDLGLGANTSGGGAPTGAAGGSLAGTYPNPTVATNANLTGPITSSGNATAVAAQTGTGTTFVMDTSPSLVTPNIGAAQATTITVAGVDGTPALVTSNTTQTGASAPAAQIKQTWNNVATTFTGILENMTDTTSAAASLLLDLQTSSVSKVSVRKDGQIISTLATGTAPLVVASTTNVANLNASSLSGATFAAPGAIGGGTPAAGTFTAITGTTITATGAFADTIDDSATNTTLTVATIAHTSSGTVANSFGAQILCNLEDDGGTNQNASSIETKWTTAASATRTSTVTINVVNAAAALSPAVVFAPTTITVPQAEQLVLNGFSSFLITQTAAAGGVRNCMVVTPAANVTVTSGTADPQVKFSFARIQTWATTTPATTYEFLIDRPTYACNAVSQTITTAATVDIVGAPAAGTNVTITNADALRIEAGMLEMVGTAGNSLRITTATANAAVAVTLGSTGPTGSTAGAPQGWLLINVAGTNRYMPFWAISILSPRWAEYRDAWLNGHKVHITLAEYEDECTYCLDAQ